MSTLPKDTHNNGPVMKLVFAEADRLKGDSIKKAEVYSSDGALVAEFLNYYDYKDYKIGYLMDIGRLMGDELEKTFYLRVYNNRSEVYESIPVTIIWSLVAPPADKTPPYVDVYIEDIPDGAFFDGITIEYYGPLSMQEDYTTIYICAGVHDWSKADIIHTAEILKDGIVVKRFLLGEYNWISINDLPVSYTEMMLYHGSVDYKARVVTKSGLVGESETIRMIWSEYYEGM